MKQRILAGTTVRVFFDDTIDTKRELIFELEAQSSLEFFALLTGTIPELSIIVHLMGENAQAHIKGLYILKDAQKLLFKTQQLHQAPHTSSSCTIKGILYDTSYVQYHGIIHVDRQAHYTNAKQVNKNILLSSKARAQSVPCLEVLTKQVQCSHGSAVGNLDKEIVFYMQSRGLSAMQAQRILLQGFASEIFETLPGDKAMQVKELII